MEQMCDLGEWFIKQLPDFSSYTSQYKPAAEKLMYYVSIANQFFSVTEICTLLGVFLVFIVLFLGCKLILKLIPTIG
jgi:hypothetical protein